jgi:hypothetical protein
MQPVVVLEDGIPRFRANKIVCYLRERAKEIGVDLNHLAEIDFPQEDREQFAQLIGYAISGYHELPYVSDTSAAQASALVHAIDPDAGGCRDRGCLIHGESQQPPPKRKSTRKPVKPKRHA